MINRVNATMASDWKAKLVSLLVVKMANFKMVSSVSNVTNLVQHAPMKIVVRPVMRAISLEKRSVLNVENKRQ